MTKNYRLKQFLFVDKSSCLYFKYRVCIWHWISYLGLKECNAMLRIMLVSHGRGLLCVLALIGPLYKLFLLAEEVMKILVIQVDRSKQFH